MPKQPRDPNAPLTPYQAAPQIENVIKRADAKRMKLRDELKAIDTDTATRIDAIRARVDDEDKLDALLKAGGAMPEPSTWSGDV